jgi:uncharacterized membrane protein YfcA
MITNKTHTVDWNNAAHIAGVVIVAIAQCAWWLAKHIGKIAVAVLAVLAKVFVALVSVWASSPEIKPASESDTYGPIDEWGNDLRIHPGDNGGPM